MEFTEAIEIIKNIVPESSANEYDGIMVKRLEASNTLDEGRTTNQTHIAISGEQMNMFPYLMADGYFKCDYNDRDEQLKKYFITQIPLYIYKDNVLYLADGEESGISFGDEKSRCVRASIVRSRRKEQADQVQLSLTTIGMVSKDFRASKLVIIISEPKPITLSRTSCLKPITTATDTIITASPMAMPNMAMRTAGLDTSFPPSLLRYTRLAIKSFQFILLFYSSRISL